MKKITLLFTMLFVLAFTGWGQIIISQYYEGTSFNKWIEITNVGTSTVDLTNPQLFLCAYNNAAADDPANNPPYADYTLTGTLDPGQVLLFKHSSAILPSYAIGINTGIYVCSFNGDDLLIISTDNIGADAWAERIDVIGNGDMWGADKSFYRNANIVSTNVTYTPSEWTQVTITAVDNATSDLSEYLGTHLYSTGSNSNPVITNIGTSPMFPLGTETVNV
ncbi:MAG TPA: hypothetical protein VIN10_00005, partial [Bacteroidales bacterium]